MLKSIFILLSFVALLFPCGAVAFHPDNDLMLYNGDGELISVWGVHGWNFDSTSWGLVAQKINGIAYIGDHYDISSGDSPRLATMP